MNIDTFICYAYTVDDIPHEPLTEFMYEHEEFVLSVDDFIDAMSTFNPDLCTALAASPVDNVLLIRG